MVRKQHPISLCATSIKFQQFHPEPETPRDNKQCADHDNAVGTSVTLSPESAHQVTYLMATRQIQNLARDGKRLFQP